MRSTHTGAGKTEVVSVRLTAGDAARVDALVYQLALDSRADGMRWLMNIAFDQMDTEDRMAAQVALRRSDTDFMRRLQRQVEVGQKMLKRIEAGDE